MLATEAGHARWCFLMGRSANGGSGPTASYPIGRPGVSNSLQKITHLFNLQQIISSFQAMFMLLKALLANMLVCCNGRKKKLSNIDDA
jgi:hypothetical protein